MTEDKVIEKIRKILALANDAGASEGERANALSQAYKWLAKHNIDMATVTAGMNADGSLSAKAPEETRGRVSSRFFGAVWTRPMCQSIADLFFCTYTYSRISANTDDVYHNFFGRESNTTTAHIVCKFVVESICKEAREYMRSIGGKWPDFRAFAYGASMKVIERAIRMKRDADKDLKADTTGTALVLADYYKTEREKNLAIMGQTRTTAQRHGALYNRDALTAGKNFGTNVSLAPQVGGSTQRQLPNKV